MKRDLDLATVDSFGDEWLRFDKSAVVEARWDHLGGKQ